jgi:IS5 family transposase
MLRVTRQRDAAVGLDDLDKALFDKIFGTWKRSYGLHRMRWYGLAKAAVQVRLTAIAYNLKRTLNLLAQPA